jgi:hypothetical protein
MSGFPAPARLKTNHATQNWLPEVFDHGTFAPLLKAASITRVIEVIQACTVDTAARMEKVGALGGQRLEQQCGSSFLAPFLVPFSDLTLDSSSLTMIQLD